VANYDDVYLGRIDLATATVHSDNSVYAQLTNVVGPERVVAMARRLGIASKLRPYLSLALGAQAVNPLELARAYAAFASGGFRIDTVVPGDPEVGNVPRVIEAVDGPDGRVVDERRPKAIRVLSARTAAHVNDVLAQAVDGGTGRRARLDDRPVAGKTGTTENYGDAWFVGYTPDLVAAVWVGYPAELRPMLSEFEDGPVSGGTYPALIWKSFMELANEHLRAEPAEFEPAPRLPGESRLVVQRDGELRLDNGSCDERLELVYFSGFGPRETADC
jgi:penicillin-binding protein 1A